MPLGDARAAVELRERSLRGDAAALLGALVAAGIPVVEFREDDGGLEQLFLQLTAPTASEPVEQAG